METAPSIVFLWVIFPKTNRNNELLGNGVFAVFLTRNREKIVHAAFAINRTAMDEFYYRECLAHAKYKSGRSLGEIRCGNINRGNLLR